MSGPDRGGEELTVVVVLDGQVLIVTAFQEENVERCHECGSPQLALARQDLRRRIGARTYLMEVETSRCTRCGEFTVSDETLGRSDAAITRELADRGPDDGASLRFLRKSIGLRSAELAELLGVAAETVSRWENDRLPIERRAAALVGAMAAEHLERSTRTIDRLRSYAKRRSPPRRAVRLAIPPAKASEPVRRRQVSRSRADTGS